MYLLDTDVLIDIQRALLFHGMRSRLHLKEILKLQSLINALGKMQGAIPEAAVV